VPGTKEYGCVIDACGNRRKPGQQAYDGHPGGKPFLQAGKHKQSPDLNPVAIPIELIFGVDAEPVEVIQADGIDALRPVRRRGATQGCMAFSMAARRFSISAILSASMFRIRECLPAVSCNSSMVARARMSRSPMGALATAQERRLSNLSALAESTWFLCSIRSSMMSTCRSWFAAIARGSPRAAEPAATFFGEDRMRPPREGACFFPVFPFAGLRIAGMELAFRRAH
jgi:hypothetical protein